MDDSYGKCNEFVRRHICCFVVVLLVLVLVALFWCWKLQRKAEGFGEPSELQRQILEARGAFGYGGLTSGAAQRYSSTLSDAAHQAQDLVDVVYDTETNTPSASGQALATSEESLRNSLAGVDSGSPFVWNYVNPSEKFVTRAHLMKDIAEAQKKIAREVN